jgi:hypothetical protein
MALILLEQYLIKLRWAKDVKEVLQKDFEFAKMAVTEENSVRETE